MIRTQIDLEENSSKELRLLALRTKKKQSELIREAVNQFLQNVESDNPLSKIKKAKGIWRKRKDLPDFKKMRREWERGEYTNE